MPVVCIFFISRHPLKQRNLCADDASCDVLPPLALYIAAKHPSIHTVIHIILNPGRLDPRHLSVRRSISNFFRAPPLPIDTQLTTGEGNYNHLTRISDCPVTYTSTLNHLTRISDCPVTYTSTLNHLTTISDCRRKSESEQIRQSREDSPLRARHILRLMT